MAGEVDPGDFLDDGGNIGHKKEEEEEEYEENLVGQIIQGEDGEFYVVMEDDGGDDDVDLGVEHLNGVHIDGSDTLVLECTQPAYAPREQKSYRGRIMTDGDDNQMEYIQLLGDDDEVDGRGPATVGAIQTAETGEERVNEHLILEPIPNGLKLRRNRVYGTCRCPECGQTFVNTARLERHLAVHQIFGSYLCPLCGKTYKYEYNLFHHWRRTCRDLNELVSLDDRKNMDVNNLRAMVDEVAQKKAEYGPIEIGISRSLLFQSGPLSRLEMPANPLGRRGTACRACNITVHSSHMAKHLLLHKGEGMVDERCAIGGFYCDLCGLMFRQHYNLIKHWRGSCAEIQANLPENADLTLDDGQLKEMVMALLKKAMINDEMIDAQVEHIQQQQQAPPPPPSQQQRPKPPKPEKEEDFPVSSGASMAPSDRPPTIEPIDVVGEGLDTMNDEDEDPFEERWADEQGAVYADDFDDDELLLFSELGDTREKWSMNNGPVQCQDCFRTFANVGRLERHRAGFHASFGSHHCILCGNRFKYDYNLLYHYRRSCPYTKTYIDKDVREQMDAASLRKMIKHMAQKDLKLTPQLLTKDQLMHVSGGVLPMTRPQRFTPKSISNDAIVRKEMMRPVLQNPPINLITPKAGLGEAKGCPICSVVFYSQVAIERHLRCVHGLEMHDFDEAHEGGEGVYTEMEGGVDGGESAEPPPLLEPQQPGEQPIHERRRTRFVDEDGVELEDVDMHRLLESGELETGAIILVGEEGEQVEYRMLEGDEQIIGDGVQFIEETVESEKQQPEMAPRKRVREGSAWDLIDESDEEETPSTSGRPWKTRKM